MNEIDFDVGDELVPADVGLEQVRGADRILPTIPGERAERVVLDHRLIVILGPMFRSSTPTISKRSSEPSISTISSVTTRLTVAVSTASTQLTLLP